MGTSRAGAAGAHFFAAAAEAMRRILIDYARARGAEKARSGGRARHSLDDVNPAALGGRSENLLAH